MDDVNYDAKGGFRRIELLTDPGRRRRWSAEEKAQIVAETLRPEARVSDVARRWQVCPQQVFGWRREARLAAEAEAASPAIPPAAHFVPMVTDASSRVRRQAAPPAAPIIEVNLAGAVVRVGDLSDGAQLTAVLRAIRALASDA
jgi:transposase